MLNALLQRATQNPFLSLSFSFFFFLFLSSFFLLFFSYGADSRGFSTDNLGITQYPYSVEDAEYSSILTDNRYRGCEFGLLVAKRRRSCLRQEASLSLPPKSAKPQIFKSGRWQANSLYIEDCVGSFFKNSWGHFLWNNVVVWSADRGLAKAISKFPF